ncbi:MAG: exodeoxyribonuclease V subunit gamma, partial [Nocardioides sp.]
VPPLLDGPLAPAPAGDVSLADLKAFFAHPVRSFLRQRLDVGMPLTVDEMSDAMPIELDGLEAWQVGDHLLREVLAGQDPAAVMTAELLRGSLPPGVLGSRELDKVVREAQRLFERTAELREGPRRSIDVDVDLGGGRHLSGTVNDVYGPRLVSLGYSRLKPRQRLMSWIDLLALTAARPDESYTAHAVGRERAGPRRALAGPVDHRAVDWLRDLVELRDEGLCRPLPLPIAAGAAWAEGHARSFLGEDVSPEDLADKQWRTDPYNQFGIEGEDADAYHRRAFGDSAPISVLAEAGLGELAWRVWEPLLTGAERVAAL